jgi:hypothetical protein
MRFSFSKLFAIAWLMACLQGSPAFANEEHGAPPAKEEPKAPKVEYIKEDGIPGRGGYVYKHVAKPKFEEPKVAPKLPPKEPPKPAEKEDPHEKKEEGHGEAKSEEAHGEPKKEEKKEEGHGEAKKEEGHGGGEHGGGHGGHEEKKPVVAAVSAVYDPAVIKLDGNNRPHTPVLFSNTYADYFVCHKIIKDKYRETVLAEMNTFADRMGLPRAQDMPCMIKIAKPNTKFPGAVYIEFYVDEKSEKECIKRGECGSTRVVMLFPKDKTGKKSKEIYRSYVLTDEKKFRRSNFCVSPEGQLLGEKNCYVALNPDWLFN